MTEEEGDEVRTSLAVERTMLAWWRTGLAALAVAIGVGRLLPELGDGSSSWPYVALGLGFAVYAGGLFAYGAVRGRTTGAQVPAGVPLVAVAGMALTIATIVLIAAG